MSKKNSAKSQKKQSKWKAGLKAGCLALGMATAWGGEARGDVTFEVSATPNVELRNAWVYFQANTSGGIMRSLGMFPANQTTTKEVLFAGQTEDFFSYGDNLYSYMLIGLYSQPGSETIAGVALSFPGTSQLTPPQTWSALFEADPYGYRNFTEANVIERINQASTISVWPLENFLDDYTETLAKQYNQYSTLTSFSTAANAGTAVVRIVPEPAAWMLLVGAAGTMLFWRRDLLGG